MRTGNVEDNKRRENGDNRNDLYFSDQLFVQSFAVDTPILYRLDSQNPNSNLITNWCKCFSHANLVKTSNFNHYNRN